MHIQTPFVARKRWEAISPLTLERMVADWVVGSLSLTEDNLQFEAANMMDLQPAVMNLAKVWNLKTLAQWDVRLIAQAMPIPDSLITNFWNNPLKLKKLLQLFDLPNDWPEQVPPSNWASFYWMARLSGMGLPWVSINTYLQTLATGLLERWLSLMTAKGLSQTLYTQSVLVLVEGQTEERLLPLLGKQVGLSPAHWWCCPVGGKSRMLATYEHARQVMTVPIIMVLDADALPEHQQLLPRLRPTDRLCLLADGELEDHLDVNLLVNTLNQAYDLHPPLTALYFDGQPRVDALKQLWREHQLGVFDKTTLATLVAENLTPHTVTD